VSQPLVILDQARRLENAAIYAMGGTCRPLATNKLAPSVSFDWLIRRNVRVIDS